MDAQGARRMIAAVALPGTATALALASDATPAPQPALVDDWTTPGDGHLAG